MADFPYQHGAKFATYGVDTSTSLSTTMPNSGVAHTKGAFVELTASTDFQASGILVQFADIGGSYRFMVDIAIGAAGSEVVVIPNILVRNDPLTAICAHFFFPISIPAGTRIAARAQSSSSTQTAQVAVTIQSGGFASQSPYSKVVALGADTAATDGVFYQTSGTANNTKSPYQQFIASTAEPIKALMLVSVSIIATANASFLVDIAIGAAASETVIIPNICFAGDTTASVTMSSTGFFPCSIPAGTRLSYREQISANGAVNYIDLILYGLV